MSTKEEIKKPQEPCDSDNKSVKKAESPIIINNKDNDEHLSLTQNDLNNDQKLSAINICLSYATYEANVYWQRNAIYLTINSIMLGAMGAFSKNWNEFFIFAVSCFGIFLNWFWVYVNKYSKFLAERWREDARAMARNSPEISEYMRTLIKKPRIKIPYEKRPSEVMNQLSGSFRILWIIVALYSLYRIGPDILQFIEKHLPLLKTTP